MFELDKYKNTSEIHMIKTIKILKYLVSIMNKRKNIQECWKWQKNRKKSKFDDVTFPMKVIHT